MRDPNQEHVIAVVFFTPGDWKSNDTSQSMMIQAGPMGPRGDFEDGIVYKNLFNLHLKIRNINLFIMHPISI